MTSLLSGETLSDPLVMLLIGGVLLLGGFVKGVVGLGLPTITLAVLTATLGLKEAMAILLVPSVLTNLFQMLSGGALLALCRRLWAFLLLIVLGSLLTSGAVAIFDAMWLSAVLGLSTLLYAAIGLAAPPWPQPGRREIWVGPLAGGVTGIVTGLTGAFVMPSVPYLQSLALPRDHLVQAMGLTFMIATVSLGVGLGGRGLISGELAVISALATLPALVGLRLGKAVRGKLSEAVFRKALFMALLGMGVWIMVKAFGL
jgi:hypothetical protein